MLEIFSACMVLQYYLSLISLLLTASFYICRFGHLSCFTTDVEMFLQVMTNEEKMKLVEKFIKHCESVEVAQAKVLGQWITIYKIQDLIGNLTRLPSDGEVLTLL